MQQSIPYICGVSTAYLTKQARRLGACCILTQRTMNNKYDLKVQRSPKGELCLQHQKKRKVVTIPTQHISYPFPTPEALFIQGKLYMPPQTPHTIHYLHHQYPILNSRPITPNKLNNTNYPNHKQTPQTTSHQPTPPKQWVSSLQTPNATPTPNAKPGSASAPGRN